MSVYDLLLDIAADKVKEMDDQSDIDEAAFAQQQQDEAQHFPAPFTPEWTQRMQRAQAELKRLSAFRLVWPHTKVIW